MSYRLRFVFLVIPVVYVLMLVGIAMARSSARHSIMRSGILREQTGGEELAESDTSSSNVHLQHFERVEFKGGVPVWSVRAGDARYFPAESVTIVNQPLLRIYRNKESDVLISGDVARLSMAGPALNSARMDGNVKGDLGNGLKFTTALGTFDVKNQIFSTRELMSVQGTGFDVSGIGFTFHLETGIMDFLSRVSSEFHSGAVPPSGLPALGSKQHGAEQHRPEQNRAEQNGAAQ